MNTLQISDECALVFGLSWLVIDGLDSRHERISTLREAGARWSASFKRNGEENIGTIAEIDAPSGKVKLLSGAAQLASMPQYAGRNVLLMLEDPGQNGNGVVAVVALVNGNVSVDALLTPAQAKVERRKYEDLCEQSDREYITCGDTKTVDPVSFPLTWEDLLPKKVGKFKTSRAVRVVPLRSELASQIAAGAVVTIALALGAFTAYGKYETYKQRQREMAAARQVDPEALYAASSATFLDQPVVLLSDAIATLRARTGGMESTLGGWRLTEIDCTTSACGMKWLRQTGTFAEFAAAAPKDWTDILYSEDGNMITGSFPLDITPKRLPPKSQWTARKTFQEQAVSRWQRLSDVQFQFQLGLPFLEAVPPGIAPEILQNSPSAIRVSTWEIKSAAWYLGESLAKAPQFVTFESMKMTVSKTDTTFEAKGKVYVES